MLNKRFHILWLKLYIKGNRNIHINFPVSLCIFEELMDCTMDLLTIVCLFIPVRDNKNSSAHLKLYDIKELIGLIMILFNSLTEEEPYDLVDIIADKVNISIRIR
jgi:hypothetical protein